jgi:hypothetical protein
MIIAKLEEGLVYKTPAGNGNLPSPVALQGGVA